MTPRIRTRNGGIARPLPSMGLALFLGLVLYGSDGDAQMPGGPPPAAPVGVLTLKSQTVRLWSTYSGRLRAVDYAEIRPQVSGRITEIRFRDGQTVKAGDVLAVIEPGPFEAAEAKAAADLAQARTNADFARIEFERAAQLIKTGAVAQRVYDERANSNRVAIATIQAAEAALKQARIDLDHAYVKAPISGRAGRVEITLGNFVQSAPTAPMLTSIVSKDGIYADFEVDEQTYLKSIRAQADTRAKEQSIPVRVNVSGDTGHPYTGTIYSFDNRLDPQSGTIRARAKFGNEDGALVPGMFVTVSLASGDLDQALVVPERAIGADQNKRFVLVVGSDNTVDFRPVTLGGQVNDQRIVTSGLAVGDRVIVEGLQHVRPKMPVAPQEVTAK